MPKFSPSFWLAAPVDRRKAVGDHLAERLLAAAEGIAKPRKMAWAETPPVFESGTPLRPDSRAYPTSAIGVGTGEQVHRQLVERADEFAELVKGITGQGYEGALRDLGGQVARQLFGAHQGSSVGFLWITAGLAATRTPEASAQLAIRTVSGEASVLEKNSLIQSAGGELVHRQRVFLANGESISLDIPARLIAGPEDQPAPAPLAIRDLLYVVSGQQVEGGTQEVVQATLGRASGDLGSLSMGEWFPSVHAGRSDLTTPHPVVCVGRIGKHPSSGSSPGRTWVDWIVLVLNPFAFGGSIDSLGVLSMSADVSYILRWDVWSAAARWAGIEHDVLDIVDGNAVTPESMSETRKRPPRITEEFRRRAREEPVEKMVARLIPMIGEQDIELLRTRLVLAQSEPPDNKRLFVDSINQMLDHFRLRIQSQGELCRLAMNRRSILLAKTSGGTLSFKDPMMTVITVPPRKVGNRFTLPQPT